MDSVATAKDIADLLRNPATWVVLCWLGREVYHAFQKRGNALEDSIKNSIVKMGELTIAIVKLEAKIENLERLANTVPKIQDDVNVLFRRVRQFAPDSTSSQS